MRGTVVMRGYSLDGSFVRCSEVPKPLLRPDRFGFPIPPEASGTDAGLAGQ